MLRTGFCSHTECDLDIKELYECHCCDKLICLKHLLQHIETSKQNKKALKDLSTITNTFQLIINEKLRQIDCENQLIKQAKELLHSEKCSTDELKSIFDKITLAIQSNHSGDELSVSSLKDETFSVDPLQSTLISSAFMDSTANTNNEESVSADQTTIDIVPLINTMDSAKDEKGKQRGAYSVYQRCPLTFDGAFGLNRREHSLDVCPETNMRKIGLYSHFLCIHKLKRDCARRYDVLFLYVIFFTVFVNPQTEIVTISDVTSSLFDQLRREHGKTLSCPCSTTIIPYKSFLLNTLSIDPICSSIFVSKQWVQSFYIPWASSFLMMDFRTTAYSQFQLLAAFCSFAERIVSQLLIDIDRQRLLSIELLSEDEVQSQVIENVILIRTSTYVQLSSSVTFLQITAQSNSLISALNTNAHVSITAIDNETFLLSVKPTIYYRKDMPLFVFTKEIYSCNLVNSVMTSAFYTISYGPRTIYDEYWPDALINYSFNISAIVDGFLSGCTPFDGLLTSTFDCLYNTKCLEQLIEYFPNLNQTNFNLTNSRLTSNQRNDSLYERLNNLFIEDWLPTIDYGKYFTDCAPLLCTYTTTEQTSLSYTMVFLFSLYGGITIILRLIAPLLVEMCSSDFVSDAWITFLSLVNTGLYNNWATRAAHQFRLLSAICQLVDKTITDAVQRFILRSLVTFNVLTESDFNLQSNTTIEQFKQSTIINFGLLLDTVHLFLRVDQPCKLSDYLLTSLRYKSNDLYNSDVWKLILSLTGMFNTTGIFNDCICAIDPYCQSPSECYYSNSNCLSILAAYMNTTYITIDTEIPWFSPEPLVYNSAISRFVPNTSLSVIVKGMMIEQWNDEASFTRYYTACAPKYCTYSYTTRTYNYIGVITKMLSTIGGLIIVLRLITPHMTNFICQFFEAKSKTPRKVKRSSSIV
ncbi:hypothetical protein I4U23_003894 [Adineta vaga]|nr:hypothetical protein I4U23_003894 [Adineta vaga]